MTPRNVILKYVNNVFPDFLSLDVESLDLEILKQIDYEHNNPKVIFVETNVYSYDCLN